MSQSLKDQIMEVFNNLTEGATLTNGELWDRYFEHKPDWKAIESATKALASEGKLNRDWGVARKYNYPSGSDGPMLSSNTRAYHYWKGNGIPQVVKPMGLTMIHPDTARLNFLEQNCLEVSPADTYLNLEYRTGMSLRAAIDELR